MKSFILIAAVYFLLVFALTSNSAQVSCTPAQAGIIGWWPGDGDARDVIGGNNGTLQNGSAFVAGKVGQAFSFDGQNDYISIPDSPSLRSSSLTIEGWFNFAATSGTRILFGKTAGTGTSESYVVYYAANTLWATIGDTTSIGDQLSYVWTPDLGTWYHIAYTFDNASGSQYLYVNGIRVASGATAKRIGYDSHPVILGAEYENELLTTFFGGLIDEPSIYNRSLTPSDVLGIFNAGSAGKCKTKSLAESAVELAISVEGAEYLFGGKGWDLNERKFVGTDQIRLGYNYCRRFDKCGNHLITSFCEIIRDKGLDCSGLVFWSYNKANGSTAYQNTQNPVYWLSADSQFRSNSQPISEGELKPGDLMFFNFGREPGRMADHVAMYIGGDNGKNVVEALNCDIGIKFSSKDELKRRSSFLGDQVGFRRISTPQVPLQILTHSPISLAVTDPDGFTITADQFIVTDREILREIPGILYYSERDIDGNGRLDDMVSTPILKPGAYLIKVIPKPGTSGTDIYSLDAVLAGRSIILAQNIPIREIPSQGYAILSTEGGVTVLDTIIQDESNGNILRFNSANGDYQFSKCNPNGFTLTGRGNVLRRGCEIALQDFPSNRRVLAQINTCQHKGIASVQVFSRGTTFTIIDRNTTNDSGTCP